MSYLELRLVSICINLLDCLKQVHQPFSLSLLFNIRPMCIWWQWYSSYLHTFGQSKSLM